jgi:hypothetical protein
MSDAVGCPSIDPAYQPVCDKATDRYCLFCAGTSGLERWKEEWYLGELAARLGILLEGTTRTDSAHQTFASTEGTPAFLVRADACPCGDVFKAVAVFVGAARLATLWEKWTGMPCGCEERRQKMNAACARLARWLKAKREIGHKLKFWKRPA